MRPTMHAEKSKAGGGVLCRNGTVPYTWQRTLLWDLVTCANCKRRDYRAYASDALLSERGIVRGTVAVQP